MLGIEFAAPAFVVEIAATLFENSRASLIFNLFDKAYANAPLKASPAPVVSITLSFKLWTSIKKLSSEFAKYRPFGPNVMIIFFTPFSKKVFADSSISVLLSTFLPK